MSLQVWLPFTDGTLKQQGLSSAIVTSSNYTVNNNGKLGKCIKTKNATGLDLGYDGNQINTGGISFGGWFKFNKDEIGEVINNARTYNSTYNTPTGQLIGNDSYGGIGIVWNSNNMYTSSPFSSLLICSNIRTSTVNRTTGSYTVVFDTWVHVFVTFNKDTGALTLYINGSKFSETVFSSFSDARSYNLMLNYAGVYGGNGPGLYIPFDCNDIRVYDHCLSPMEVKRISQGLVLHYPLNRMGFGQENLMPNSVEMPVGSANPSTGTWRLAGDSRMTRSRVAISDAPTGASTYGFQSVGLQTAQDASCWGIDSFPKEDGETYTLSAWGRIVGGSTTAAMLGFSLYNATTLSYGGTYGSAVSSDAKYYGSGAYDYAGGQLNPNGNWTRIYRTFTSTQASGNIYIGFNTAKTGNNVTLQLCGVKLEKGNKMTPWTPNINEPLYTMIGLNDSIEYDTSGYCNNGTNNNIVYTSDTPKYAVSSVFNGSDSYIKVNDNNWMIKGMSEMTVNLWAKATTWPTNGGRLLSCTESGGFNLEGGNSGYWRFPIYVYTNSGQTSSAYKYDSNEIKIADLIPNEWNMITLVYDNTGTKTYLNGELHHTYTNTSYGINFNTSARLFLGCEANVASPYTPYFNGMESDFRIYTTALSADDVKSLYQNTATIDADGTIHGAVR